MCVNRNADRYRILFRKIRELFVDCHVILPKQCHGILSVANKHSKIADEKGKGLAAPGPFDSRQQSTAPDYPLTPGHKHKGEHKGGQVLY
jgi:hypothetical protein